MAVTQRRRYAIPREAKKMNTRQEIAIGIALQTQVLKICPIHNHLYCDEELYSDDEHMARAFAVAIELVNQHPPYAEEFHHDAHVLTDLLSSTIGAAPECCPECMPQQSGDSRGLVAADRLSDRSSEAFAFR
jgi:hypothetical protein